MDKIIMKFSYHSIMIVILTGCAWSASIHIHSIADNKAPSRGGTGRTTILKRDIYHHDNNTVLVHKVSKEATLLNPCNVVDDDMPVSPANFSTILTDLKTRADGLIKTSADIKQTIKDNKLLQGYWLTVLSSRHYMDGSNVTKTEEITLAAETDPVSTLQSHVRLVKEMVTHVNVSRTTGSLPVDGSQAVLEKLQNLEMAMYDCLCDLKIALRSQGSDMETYEPALKADFEDTSGTMFHEYSRLYVLMNDSERMSGFLYAVYEHMYNHVKIGNNVNNGNHVNNGNKTIMNNSQIVINAGQCQIMIYVVNQ